MPEDFDFNSPVDQDRAYFLRKFQFPDNSLEYSSLYLVSFPKRVKQTAADQHNQDRWHSQPSIKDHNALLER